MEDQEFEDVAVIEGVAGTGGVVTRMPAVEEGGDEDLRGEIEGLREELKLLRGEVAELRGRGF